MKKPSRDLLKKNAHTEPTARLEVSQLQMPSSKLQGAGLRDLSARRLGPNWGDHKANNPKEWEKL
jgi:hypothetical protein